jgi:hypothetical protein
VRRQKSFLIGTATVQFFRFAAALVLVVTISLAGIALEKDNLSRQRAISLQQYRIEQLLDRQAHLRLRINELTSPMSEVARVSNPCVTLTNGVEAGRRTANASLPGGDSHSGTTHRLKTRATHLP